MQNNSIKNRLNVLESRQQRPSGASLQDRIARYERMLTTGDYSCPDGERLKASIVKYAKALEAISGDEK